MPQTRRVLFGCTPPGNTIGGTTASARNIISGNADAGVWITSSGSNELVEGNYIGTERDRLARPGE